MMRVVMCVLVVMMVVCGCGPVRYVPVRETVSVREVVRDTAIVVRGDSAMLAALLECDSTGRVRMAELLEARAGRLVGVPEVMVVDNRLTVTARVDSFAVWARLKDRYMDSERTVMVVENRLTDWQRWQIWGFWVMVVFAGVRGLFKWRLKGV